MQTDNLKFKNMLTWEYGDSLKDIERQIVMETLRSVNWNRCWAAHSLDISIRNLRMKIQQYREQGIEVRRSPYGSTKE